MVTLVLVKNPFSPQDGREIKYIEAEGTVFDLMEEYRIAGVELQATVNGYSVDDDTPVKDDDFIVIYPIIEGGGDKGGKGILGIVAAIALSVVAFGVGGALASVNMGGLHAGMWAVGASHFGLASYLGMAAVMFLGSSLVGRFMGQKADLGAYESENSKATYSWGSVQTMEGQNNAVALTYGTVKSGGQTIGKYINIDDDEEYLNWLVAAGEGELTFKEIKLNDNDYGNYDDVEVTTRKGTNNQEIISEFGDTYASKTLSYRLDDSWATDSAPGSDTRGLIFTIEFPQGLYYVADSGKTQTAWVTLDIEYKIDGGSWTNLFKEVSAVSSEDFDTVARTGITLQKNVGAGNYNFIFEGILNDTGSDSGDGFTFGGVSIQIGSDTGRMSASEYRNEKTIKVGSFYVDPSKWVDAVKNTLGDGGTVSGTITVSAGSGIGTITGDSRSAIRKQFRVNKITAGEYEVRVKIRDRQYSEDEPRAASTCYWTTITSVIYDDFCYPCTALIGIKAKASDQISGSPSLTFLKTRSKVWVWNGSSYVQKNANNPAWACYDLLHQARKLYNVNTDTEVMEVRGVPKERIRYSDFAAWATYCNTEVGDLGKLTVNIEINTSGEVLDVINQRIAPIGRGMVVRFGTNYGCIYDHVQDPVQMFGMGNIIAGTFSEEFLKVTDRANCVEVTYTNADADYERDVITIYGDTFDDDGYAKTAQLTMDGITSYKQAYREGKYQLMCNKYQLRTVSFEAGIDSIACTVGDVILVAHDVPKWAYSGRIEEVNGRTMLLPCYVTDLTKSYRVQWRTVKDNIYTQNCTIVSSSADGWTTITLSADYSESDPPQAGDVFDLAIANIGSKPFVVKSITRSQDFTRHISCVEYAEALYDESYSVPPIQYSQEDTKVAKNVTNLSASQYQYTDENRVKHGVMSVSWKKPKNGGRFTVSVSTDKKKWETKVSGTENNNVEFEVKAKTNYYVRVVTILGLSQSTGVISGLIDYGQDVPPSVVTGLTYKIDPADRTKAELSWNANTDIDFRYYEVAIEGGKTYTTASNIITIISSADNPTVTIKAVDNAGNKSTAASVVVPIVNYPSDVTGFAVTQQTTDRSMLEFTWNAVTDSDLSQYELRVGSSWGGGTQFARTKTRKTTYKLTASGNYTFWIAAQNAAENYSSNPASLSRYVNLVPDAVTNLTLTQNPKDRSKVIITFTASPGEDIAKYVIKYGNTWDSGTTIVEIKDTRFEWQVPASGTYNVMVRAVTVAEFESATANRSITVTVEPMDVTGFTATQSATNKTLILLSWDSVQQVDVAYYIVKQGANWNTAEVIAPRISGTTLEVKIDAELPYTWQIKAVTIAGYESQFPAKLVNQIFNLNPSPVETIQLRQNPNDRSQLQIQWTPVSDGDLVGYQVKIGDMWDSGEPLPITNEVYATYVLPSSGNYHVMIKTLNSAGFYSDERSADLRCKVEPTNATNFIAYQNGEEVELYWTKSVDTDVVGYEIREGSSYNNGSLISTMIPNNYYKVGVDMERLFRYHIVAINRAGFMSDQPISTQVMVENLPPKNVIVTFDEIVRQSGTHSNTEFGESLINFQTVGGRFSDYPSTRWSDLGGADVLKLAKDTSTNLYYESGVYELEQIDIGNIITADISCYFVSTAMGYTQGVSAVLRFRTSLDGINWIDWMDFKPLQRRFRYIEFKVLLATEDTTKTPEVNHLLINIDVPDTDIAISASISSSGTTVPYGHEFIMIPNVTATAIGEFVHAVVVSKSRTDCVIKIMDNNNVATSGTADIKIKGY